MGRSRRAAYRDPVRLLRPAAAALLALATVAGTAATTAVPTAVAAVAGSAAPVDTADLAVTGFALGSLRNGTLDRDADVLDTVTVAGVGLRAAGDSVAPTTPDMARVRAAAEARGLATELVVSNYSNRLEDFDPRAVHRLLDDPDHVAAVARQVADRATDGGWGGVNVDLERVRASDAAGLTDFVEAVDDALPQTSTVSVDVSAATSTRQYRQRGYHLGGLGRAADVVVLMTYDLHGPTWSGAGPVGDLRWQRRAVEAASEHVDPARLDLGVAGYGYTWPRRGTGRTLTPAGARRLAERDGVRPRWHADSAEWSVVLRDGTRIWWSDGRSYRTRVRLADRLGLHGVAVWRLGSADPLV